MQLPDTQTNLGSNEDQLIEFWNSVSSPVKDVVGQWYCAVFQNNDVCWKSLKTFLLEKNGPVAHSELDCLKPQVGNNCILGSYSENETDLYMFKIENVFGGPLAFSLPPKKRAWSFPDLNKVKGLNRSIIREEQVKLNLQD